MFIRAYQTKNKKTGTVYTTHKLVESFQTDKGPRQRIVMSLGKVTLPKSEWKRLAYALEQRLSGEQPLLEEDPHITAAASDIMDHFEFQQQRAQRAQQRKQTQEPLTIDLNSVSTSHSRSLGPELLGLWAMRTLGFEQLLHQCGMTDSDGAMVQAVVLAKLIAPRSDLATWKRLRHHSSIPELLGMDPAAISCNAVYEAADRLYVHKNTIEAFLREREGKLFRQETTLYLYDLTNTYFEGSCHRNPLAKRGKSKEKRSDCPLVTLALLVDGHGFPIFSDIYRGSQSEPETLDGVLERLRQQHGALLPIFQPTIVMDRGIATKANLEKLRSESYPYLVVERRAVEKEYQNEFAQAPKSFTSFKNCQGDAVYVKQMPSDGTPGCRVLVLSETRAHTEEAMDALKEQPFLDDLQRLRQSIVQGNIKKLDKILVRIGRLLERYPSVAKHYEIVPDVPDGADIAVDLRWNAKPTRQERSVLTGCYVIETSHEDMTATEIWKAYAQLTTVEAGFRALKTDLGMRPIFHQTAERTQGHLFLSVVAYHLLNTIELSLRQQDYHHRWSTVRDMVANHQRTTVILTDVEDKIHHVRVSGTPEPPVRTVYELLGVKDPLRAVHTTAGARL